MTQAAAAMSIHAQVRFVEGHLDELLVGRLRERKLPERRILAELERVYPVPLQAFREHFQAAIVWLRSREGYADMLPAFYTLVLDGVRIRIKDAAGDPALALTVLPALKKMPCVQRTRDDRAHERAERRAAVAERLSRRDRSDARRRRLRAHRHGWGRDSIVGTRVGIVYVLGSRITERHPALSREKPS